MPARSNCILTAVVLMLTPLTCAASDEYYGDTPPREAVVLEGYSEEMAREQLSQIPLQPIEGVWEYPDEMMTLAIERFTSPQFSRRLKYRIVLLSSDDMSLLPGTVIGYIAESADDKKFELWLYSEQDGRLLTGATKCVATLNNEANSLVFTQQSKMKLRIRYNLTRFLPKIFRMISVTPQLEEEKLPVGFKKIYPSYDDNGSQSGEVRYL